jgi:hypothetical protein
MMIHNAMRVAVVVLACGVVAWTQEAPKAELDMDYSYARYAPSASYTNGHSLNGGGGRIVFNVAQWLGLGMDLQGYNSNTTTFNIPANSPLGNQVPISASVSGNLFTYLFGPVLKFRNGRVQPFFDVMPGAAHSSVYGTAFKDICQPAVGVSPCTVKSSPNGDAFALSAGGGLDIPINQRVYFRPGEFDYLYTRFTNQFTNAGQNNFRYLGGLGVNMGLPNPKIPTMACAASPSEVLPWAGPVKASATPTDFNPKHDLTYNWESTGGSPMGQGGGASIDTSTMQPGQYTVKATATDPKQKKNNSATCSASFTVKQPRPPVLSCSATPTNIQPGQPVTITVSGSSPDGSAIDKRSFKVSGGNITEGQTTAGTNPGEFTTTATLDTTGVQPGSTIAVNVSATDVHGQTGSCEADEAMAAAPATAPMPTAQMVGDCSFNDKKRPGRVDNECKAKLDSVAMQAQRDSESKLVVVGFADPGDPAGKNLESIRAANVRDYLTKGEGKQMIDAARVQILKSADTSIGKAAQVYLVPQNATLPLQNTNAIDESVLPKKRAGAK